MPRMVSRELYRKCGLIWDSSTFSSVSRWCSIIRVSRSLDAYTSSSSFTSWPTISVSPWASMPISSRESTCSVPVKSPLTTFFMYRSIRRIGTTRLEAKAMPIP
ncbi:hypothetical protein D3C81_1762650 [compost metagenome]